MDDGSASGALETRARDDDAQGEFTGERYMPGCGGDNVELEHLHRYLLALEIVPGARVLDIACGEGYGSSMLAQRAEHVIGVDISASTVEHAIKNYQRPNLEFLLGDCTDIPLASGSIDVVVSFETIEHHDRHEQMMSEIKRVLDTDGVLIISSPDRQRYSIDTGNVNAFHVRELFEEEFKSLLGRHFRNTAYFGQRILYGSSILSNESPHVARNFWRAESGTIVSGDNRPLYWIGIASDATLPRVSAGIFEQPIDDSETVQAYRGAIGERELTIAAQQRQIDQAQQQIAQLEQDAITLRTQSVNLSSKFDELESTRAAFEQSMQRQKDEMARLLNEATERRNIIAGLHAELAAAQAQISVGASELATTAAELARFKGMRVVRARGFVARVTRPLRKRLSLTKAAPPARWDASEEPSGPIVDPVFYLAHYPDVAATGVDPQAHYIQFGRREGRIPRRPGTSLAALPEFELPVDAKAWLPLVSVVVPAYNHARFLPERLDSIANQSYKGELEIILLDDASTDGSLDVLQSFAARFPRQTRVIANSTNSGSAFRQWRKAFAEARGDLVWIAESDDVCDLNMLEALVPMMANPAVMLAFCRTVFFEQDKSHIIWTLEEYLHNVGPLRFDVPWIRSAADLSWSGFAELNLIPNVSGALIRHPGDLPVLREESWMSLKLAGDWIFYLELAKGGLVAYTPEATNYHRSGGDTITTKVVASSAFDGEVTSAKELAASIYSRPHYLHSARSGVVPTSRVAGE